MNTQVAERQISPIAELRVQLETMEGQFKAALPAHIPVERFCRVVMTALQNNPDLVTKVDRRSLWNAAIRAAQDGLLPDGRDGAIVAYGSQAQWMPMIGGLRKKVRNSGEIATWDAQVVHQNDKFQFRLGDDPFILHEPILDSEPGPVIAAYSIAVLKTGEKSREVMSVAAIEKVRARSKAKNNGPWVTDYEEMCRKTVARRHSKVLPMSTDLDDLIRRDDELYDFDAAKQHAQETHPRSLAGKLDVLAQLPAGDAPATASGESTEQEDQPSSPQAGQADAAGQAASTSSSSQSPSQGSAAASTESEAAKAADTAKAGEKTDAKKTATKAETKDDPPQDKLPATEREYVTFANGWRDSAADPVAAMERWRSEKSLRNKCNVGADVRDDLLAKLQKHCNSLQAKEG